jgi:hypothetical protein
MGPLTIAAKAYLPCLCKLDIERLELGKWETNLDAFNGLSRENDIRHVAQSHLKIFP